MSTREVLKSLESKDRFPFKICELLPSDRGVTLDLIRRYIGGGDATEIAKTPILTGYVVLPKFGEEIVAVLTYELDVQSISPKAAQTGKITALAVKGLPWQGKGLGRALDHFFRGKHPACRVRVSAAKAGNKQIDAAPIWRHLGYETDSDGDKKSNSRLGQLRYKPLPVSQKK